MIAAVHAAAFPTASVGESGEPRVYRRVAAASCAAHDGRRPRPTGYAGGPPMTDLRAPASDPGLDRSHAAGRVATWLERWGAILPLLVAEFVVWLGFGGLLPVLPLYFTEQGIDLATLGLVIAAWPAARLRERADLRLAGRPHRAGAR